MAFTKEEHDNLLMELVDDKTGEGRRSIIAHELRKDFEDAAKWMEENTKKIESAKAEHELLVDVNRKLYMAGNSVKQKEQPKSFSQTITIDEIERKNRQY